jgi:acetyl-CoA/propionyl-CoA carboxylase biotin carboxyl carrier protein
VRVRRVLIANRGEIAVRIIRACRELGLTSVAACSDADLHGFPATLADRAVRIGPAPAADSYLSIGAIIDAARRSDVDAIHPGYGFLSEDAAFAAACSDAGIVFIGPPASVIERMGSKVGARRLAAAAGVPVVPGETPEDQSDASVAAAAQTIGFPVLIKPSEGGGGIGMKAVHDAAALAAAIAQARREATAAFGDGTLYVERLIERPRHVEIQVFADDHGGVVHLFERECSLQRRHQKVIEESPSTALTPGLRARMADAALAVARAAGYRNAGTVEFLVDGAGDAARFYFLEMNTRLQVEHPVTELVTGRDLVRAQIQVATGQPLPWAQDALDQRGHAIEARIYAEDPDRNDLPQAGRLLLYREPVHPGVRIDAGVVEGSDVPVHYDPLLAKLIGWGETRDAARARTITALEQFAILGVRTNVGFLIDLLSDERFASGDIDTGFIARWRGAAVTTAPVPPEVLAVAAAARTDAGHRETAGGRRTSASRDSDDPWSTLRGVRV